MDSNPIVNPFTPRWQRRLDEAVMCYLRRRAKRDHPRGSVDSTRTWQPCPATEARSCCANIRNSLKRHCRSITHVANLYSIHPSFLRRRLHEIRAGLMDSPDRQDELDADALRHRHDAAEHTTPQWQSNTGKLPFAPAEHGDDDSESDQLVKP